MLTISLPFAVMSCGKKIDDANTEKQVFQVKKDSGVITSKTNGVDDTLSFTTGINSHYLTEHKQTFNVDGHAASGWAVATSTYSFSNFTNTNYNMEAMNAHLCKENITPQLIVNFYYYLAILNIADNTEVNFTTTLSQNILRVNQSYGLTSFTFNEDSLVISSLVSGSETFTYDNITMAVCKVNDPVTHLQIGNKALIYGSLSATSNTIIVNKFLPIFTQDWDTVTAAVVVPE